MPLTDTALELKTCKAITHRKDVLYALKPFCSDALAP